MLRPHILAFYHFARAIDDIADAPSLSSDEKLSRLDAFDDALQGRETGEGFGKAVRLRESLRHTGVTDTHARDLIRAFRQDAVKNRYESWDDLMGYCAMSAAPVGRYLLDLHGASEDLYGPSDALCCALQVINHLQDCAEDHALLDRIYLPLDWMAEAGATPDMLQAQFASPEIRKVIDRALSGTDELLREAVPLARGLRKNQGADGTHTRRLGLEAAVIQQIAVTLATRLRWEDPIADRVALGKISYLVCGIKGLLKGLRGG